MAASSAPNRTAVNEPRPAGAPAEGVPPNAIPGKNPLVAARSEAAGDSDPGTNGQATGQRFGEILVALGYVTQAQIEQALESKEDAHARLGLRLLRKGLINEAQLAYAISVRLRIPFTDLAELSETQPAAIASVPERIARRYSLIPLRIEGNLLVVAMSSPGNVYALDVVRAVTGYEVKPVAAPESAIRQALERCYGIRSELQSSASELATTGTAGEIAFSGEEESVTDTEQILNEAEDAPVVKYVDSLINDSIAARASDIHIEPGREAVSVRVRVDGRLRQTIPPPKQMQNAVISRIKILSRLDIAEKRLPLDGRMRARFQGREVDLRVSTLPSIYGEKVVLRILDRASVQLDLNKIITDAAFLAHLQKILARQNGMILVTGPTGSGKTTTLYASLQYVKNVTKNVISVEDPIEYEVEGVTQVHARPEIGLTFARALRSILRQDPDIIMVGEMRDLETLEIGIRSALTGHLVLSTIHTNDSVSTITRMVNMGTEPYLIASTLITAAAQRLVRSICPHCKEEYDLSDPVRARMRELLGEDIPKRLWRGAGCATCAGTGYRGRAAVFEYFHLDDEAKELVTRRASETDLRAYQKKHSSGSLLENALRKAIAGITSVDDAFEMEMSI